MAKPKRCIFLYINSLKVDGFCDIITCMIVDIIRYGNNGEGIALNNGKITFVKDALMGEKVDINITKQTDKYDVAEVTNIIKSSQNRVSPVCPYYGVCGGCQLQHANYEEQLRIKRAKINGNLKKYAHFDANVEIVSSDFKFNYRNHMRFVVFNHTLGLHKSKSSICVDVDDCRIANDEINFCIEAINNFLKITRIDINEVDIKSIKNQVLITFIAEKNVNFDINEIKQFLSPFTSYGFYLYTKNNKHLKHIYGLKKIEYNDGINCFVRPISFLQVNDQVAHEMYNYVCELVKDEVVVDAYCGRGILTCKLAKNAKQVYGIEIEKSSIEDAIDIQTINNIKNVQFILGDTKTELPKLKQKIDCIVLDPPRAGAKQIMQTLLDIGANKLIYISCASNTLARDLGKLLDKYSIKEVKAFDMFPQTDEVETVVLLEKINEKQ